MAVTYINEPLMKIVCRKAADEAFRLYAEMDSPMKAVLNGDEAMWRRCFSDDPKMADKWVPVSKS